MEQLSLLDWLDSKRIILELPPAQCIQHRNFIIKQLKPIMQELESLDLDYFAVCEALTHYQNHYQEKHQKDIVNSTCNRLKT